MGSNDKLDSKKQPVPLDIESALPKMKHMVEIELVYRTPTNIKEWIEEWYFDLFADKATAAQALQDILDKKNASESNNCDPTFNEQRADEQANEKMIHISVENLYGMLGSGIEIYSSELMAESNEEMAETIKRLRSERRYFPNRKYTVEMFEEYFGLVKKGMVGEKAARYVLQKASIDEEKFPTFMRSANSWKNNEHR